jgi:hypothetical protein
MRLSRGGVSAGVPVGWDVEIIQRQRGEDEGRAESIGKPGLVILHAANFPLPTTRSDFGHDVIETMGMGEVFVAIIEYDGSEASQPLFASEGMPKLDSESLAADYAMGAVQGQAAVQHFFHIGNRAFCLYAAVGSHRLRARTLPLINAFLETLDLTTG